MTPSEELQKRLAVKPDTWTLAFWKQQFEEVLKAYRGLSHANACVLAQAEDDQKRLNELTERIVALEADRAKIGELQAANAAIQVRVERMAEFLNRTRKDKTNGDL